MASRRWLRAPLLGAIAACSVPTDDSRGAVAASHSMSYLTRFVDTPRTHLVEKPAGGPLTLRLERRQGRVVVTGVR